VNVRFGELYSPNLHFLSDPWPHHFPNFGDLEKRFSPYGEKHYFPESPIDWDEINVGGRVDSRGGAERHRFLGRCA
jgi:hypothetical protein